MNEFKIGTMVFDNCGRLWKVTESFFNAIYELVEVRPQAHRKAKVKYVADFELMTQFKVK